MKICPYILFSLLLGSCSADDLVESKTKDNVASYQVVVTLDWNENIHPSDLGPFPGGAHFSPLIGSFHLDESSFFVDKGLASPGMEAMAETGATSQLANEIQAQIEMGSATKLIIADRGSGSTGKITLNPGETNGDFAFFSMVSMIAPSPDWFIAVQNIALKDADGSWLETIEVPFTTWDAGTDDGVVFTAANQDSQPQGSIVRISGNQNKPLGFVRLIRE